ncbi:YheC/YheD family protein [Marinicrinis lubricantis]|uniref:YheC/YheD family protein n=1 Tax=Marinicrinis lubricantis TaxID=2086470 RepID=A0ABW1IUQ1_9BACL
MLPYAGILISEQVHRGIKNGRMGIEKLTFYIEGGEAHGITPTFFRLKDIRLHDLRVKAWLWNGEWFVRRMIPLPACIHNRTFFSTKKARIKYKQLLQHTYTFNRNNRYGKLHIHQLLMLHEGIRPHLPHTEIASLQNIHRFMKLYNHFFLKPNSSSIGRGIWFFRKKGDFWECIQAGSKFRRSQTLRFRKKVPWQIVHAFRTKKHLLQKQLPLAHYEGRPFDFRISVQRDGSGEWQVTGMVGKVAAPSKMVTNLAQGGSALTLEQLLAAYPNLNPDQVREHLQLFSLEVAQHLSKHLPHLADIGLDVGITSFGFPVFIECNGRDQRYSFKNGGLDDIWKATFYNPMAYASYWLKTAAVSSEKPQQEAPIDMNPFSP